MEFPDRDVALAWVGRTLVDRDGTEIGACTAVFTDDATRVTEWVCSEVDGVAVFIPAVGASESGGQVQVAVSRTDIASAPPVGGEDHISDEEEARLYRHYGIPHSRDASPSLLPTDEPEPATGGAPEAGTLGDLGTPAASTVPESPMAAEAGPTGTEDAVAGLSGTPDELAEPTGVPEAPGPRLVEYPADDRSGDAAPARGLGRRVLPAVGALAGAGMALGAALWARRLRRRRPPTRTELLAARARAASAAVTAGTSRFAASAAPLLATAGELARQRPGRAGAAVGLPLAGAVALPVLRRRRRSAAAGQAEYGEPDYRQAE